VLYTVARIRDPYALNDPDREPLRVGTFVNANIEGRELEGIVSLPRYLLRAGNFVWVVDSDQRLRNRQVSMLRTGGDLVYVTAGLDDGDLVSLTSLDNSFAGSRVTINSSIPSNQLDKHGRSTVESAADILEAAAIADDGVSSTVAGGR
jgi:hypothetical protein